MFERGLDRVDDLTRQECCNDRGGRKLAALPDQRFQSDAVELVFDRRKAHAIIRFHIQRMQRGKICLRVLHRGEFQTPLLVFRNGTVRLERRLRRDGIEFAPGGGDCRALQFADLLLERDGDFFYDRRDLRHIMNLPVEHRARFMFLPICGNYRQGSVVLFDGNNSDHGSGSDVERINLLSIGIIIRGRLDCFRPRRSSCGFFDGFGR